MGEDPHAWLEDLGDQRAVRWALYESSRTVERFRAASDALYPRMLRAYSAPQVGPFSITGRGYYFVYRERGYSVKLLDRSGEILDVVGEERLGGDSMVSSIYSTPEGDLLAYFYTEGGGDEGLLVVVNPEGGGEVDRIRGRILSAAIVGRRSLYYVKMSAREPCPPDGSPPPCPRIYLRELGGEEEPVFGEGLRAPHRISLAPSSDGSKALVGVWRGWSGSTLYAGDLDDPGSWVRIYGDGSFVATPVDYSSEGGCYIVASYRGRGLGEVLCVREGGAPRAVVPEREEHLEGAALLGSRLALVYTRRTCSHYLRSYTLSGELAGIYDPGKPHSIVIAGRPLRGEAVAVMSTFTKPFRVVRLSEKGLAPEVLFESGDLADVVIEDGWAVSEDGTQIHYFRVRRRDSAEGSPALVHGYGGFGVSMTPRFLPWAVPFLEDGGVLVVANLRGGSEYGEEWHRAGMRENKVKVFQDFASVILSERARGARAVGGTGVSNGGLLVAATMVLWPELLEAAVIGYPVVDLLRFHRLYIGSIWIPEYGDPEDPQDRAFLERYSPYQGLRDGVKYPPAFIYTGLNDDRVHPAHALKLHARLKELGQESYLRVETASGHMGARPDVRAREASDFMAFLYEKLGVAPRGLRGGSP